MKHWKALLPLTGGDHWLPIHVRHSSQKQSSFLHKDVPEKGTSREKVTPGSRFTRPRAYELLLACQQFISKLLLGHLQA